MAKKRSKCAAYVGALRNLEGAQLDVWLAAVKLEDGSTIEVDMKQTWQSISSVVTSKLIKESVKLVYGKGSDIIREGKFAGVEAFSGTGACRLLAKLQRRFFPQSRIYLPHPTWSNHHNIRRDAQIPTSSFCYYDSNLKSLNFTALWEMSRWFLFPATPLCS
ncbi:aspartate aminotransferase, mitochondrial-like isoform X2 [Euphorbia lathyris]|uniref:aspartate aminotransferase, mitochondrial-like isoform X2 n=1 Tax=Euphorbia lathyris TaxID=212925 RepID=UPI0033144087